MLPKSLSALVSCTAAHLILDFHCFFVGEFTFKLHNNIILLGLQRSQVLIKDLEIIKGSSSNGVFSFVRCAATDIFSLTLYEGLHVILFDLDAILLTLQNIIDAQTSVIEIKKKLLHPHPYTPFGL